MRRMEEADVWQQGDKHADWYEAALRRTQEAPIRKAERMKVIHPEDMPWEICRQGKLKHVISDEMPAPTRTMNAYFQEIPPGGHSGKHRHMSEEAFFVLEGSGYDLHWDTECVLTDRYEWEVDAEPKRFDWQAGDLVVIPLNTIHQHFNADPERPARILCITNNLYKFLEMDEIEQLEGASDWTEEGSEEEAV